MTEARIPVLIIGLLISTITGAYSIANPRIIEVETPVLVETPVIHTVYLDHIVLVNHTVTQVEYIEKPVLINNTKTITIHENLTDWRSKTQLLTFIINDDTDKLTYSTDFDCDDFAIRTINNAAKQGHRIYFFYQYIDRDTAHAMCMAYVEKQALYIIWEPQNDAIWAEWSSTRGG